MSATIKRVGKGFQFDKKIAEWNKQKPKLLEEIKDESLKFFKDNYNKEGFEDSVFEKWKPKKRPNGQPTLVATGLLRKSFKAIIGRNKVTISNPVAYGLYHNQGTSRLPKRKFLGNSRVLEVANAKRIIKHLHPILFKK